VKYFLDTHALLWYLFDKLLITMAQENNLTIVKKDTKIPLYDVKTVC